MSTRRITIAIVLLLLVTGFSACGDDTEVGSGIDTDPLKGKLEDFNTTTTAAGAAAGGGQATTTSALEVGAKPAGAATTVAPTTAPPTTVRATTTTVDRSFTITINGDKSGKQQIEPNTARVRVGTPVKFVNEDSQPHGVYSREAGFSSPEIAPGGSFTWTPKATGTFPLRDTKRPYVTATIEVV